MSESGIDITTDEGRMTYEKQLYCKMQSKKITHSQPGNKIAYVNPEIKFSVKTNCYIHINVKSL